MKSVIKRAARTFNAVSMVVEETALNGVHVMKGIGQTSEGFYEAQYIKHHFRTQKRLAKWKDKASKLGTDLPEIPKIKL